MNKTDAGLKIEEWGAKVGEIAFRREEANDFPFECGYRFIAMTLFGTEYHVEWTNTESAEEAANLTSGGREMSEATYARLVDKYGAPGDGQNWSAVYMGHEVGTVIAEESTLSDVLNACKDHYRRILMRAMAEVGVMVAGLPILPPEGLPEFSQEMVDNWTPA